MNAHGWITNSCMVAMFAIHLVPALAAAPMMKTQPGFYRMMLGDVEVTALNDGVVDYPTAQLLPTATPEQIKKGLSENDLTDPVGMSYNAFLINTGSKLVLIDTGTGAKLESVPAFHGTGHLIANLRAAGYQPEQVDEVYITHLGPDHVGGLTLEAERAFPNAIVRAPKAEVDLFLRPENAPAWTRSWTKFWADLFAPYMKAGRFESIDGDTVLTPGIRALATHGHAPGHTSYVVESKGQTLIVMGIHRSGVRVTQIQRQRQFSAFAYSRWPLQMMIGWLAGTYPFLPLATFGPLRDAMSGCRQSTPFLISS